MNLTTDFASILLDCGTPVYRAKSRATSAEYLIIDHGFKTDAGETVLSVYYPSNDTYSPLGSLVNHFNDGETIDDIVRTLDLVPVPPTETPAPVNHTTVGVTLSNLLSSLPITANPLPCITMPETFPLFHYNHNTSFTFGGTRVYSHHDGGITIIEYTYKGVGYSLTLDTIDYDENAPEEYKFVPNSNGDPNAFFAWVPEESLVRELVVLFIAREFMLGMEN